MTNQERAAKLQTLKDTADAAADQARREWTQENRQATIAASRALSDFMVAEGLLPKARGYASRAGQRQAAERRAQALDAQRRAAARRFGR